MGSSAFARRYLRNHSYFLFLWLLRCFSSPGSLRHTMDSCDGTGRNRWVPPFRHLRINAYVQLPGAFRSLSRLSSALSAKASALRLSSLNLFSNFPLTVSRQSAVLASDRSDDSVSGKHIALRFLKQRFVYLVFLNLSVRFRNLFHPLPDKLGFSMFTCSVFGFQGSDTD